MSSYKFRGVREHLLENNIIHTRTMKNVEAENRSNIEAMKNMDGKEADPQGSLSAVEKVPPN